MGRDFVVVFSGTWKENLLIQNEAKMWISSGSICDDSGCEGKTWQTEGLDDRHFKFDPGQP
jgi:hypothetical protein